MQDLTPPTPSRTHQIKGFIEEGVHPQIVIRSMRQASTLAVQRVKEIAVPFEGDKGREMLLKCAGTALNSKLISRHQDLFAPMVVDAVSGLKSDLSDLNLIGVKKVPGGEVRQSFLVRGVAFKKTFSYAGFEQMTKKFVNPKILLLNVELELKSEKENAEVRITDPDQYQSIVDAEWNVIYEKVRVCAMARLLVVFEGFAQSRHFFKVLLLRTPLTLLVSSLSRVASSTSASTAAPTLSSPSSPLATSPPSTLPTRASSARDASRSGTSSGS